MRRSFLILAVIIGFIGFGKAQDIIQKQDGIDIKAKVLEITDLQIKYKDFDFQNGPTRNININEVFMITYENGQKEVFYRQPATSPIQKAPKTQIQSNLMTEFYRIGNDDEKMLVFFLKNKYLKYYNDFESACGLRHTGKGLLAAGLVFTGAGSILMVVGLVSMANNPYNSNAAITTIVGYGFIGVGEILTIVSIPISAVAGSRKRAIKNEFAREQFGVYSYKNQSTLNLGYTGNGIGVNLKF